MPANTKEYYLSVSDSLSAGVIDSRIFVSLFLKKWSYFHKKFTKVLFVHSYKICKAVWSFRGELLH